MLLAAMLGKQHHWSAETSTQSNQDLSYLRIDVGFGKYLLCADSSLLQGDSATSASRISSTRSAACPPHSPVPFIDSPPPPLFSDCEPAPHQMTSSSSSAVPWQVPPPLKRHLVGLNVTFAFALARRSGFAPHIH
eukprot:Mycagemm_TRINITY_DN10266_c0_g1::TRINITY_DN10266_c0_g1_i2::g.3825::m.3825 type:complete len:135 gc:universal TRINITY_DN10266_c0_g1_i2:936-1340(+)